MVTSAKICGPNNRKELSTEEGTVPDGTVLYHLYLQRDRVAKKRRSCTGGQCAMDVPLSRETKIVEP